MSSYITVTPNEFDVKRITITEPKKKNEKWQSAVLFESSPFYLQTEEGGRAPFQMKKHQLKEKQRSKQMTIN